MITFPLELSPCIAERRWQSTTSVIFLVVEQAPPFASLIRTPPVLKPAPLKLIYVAHRGTVFVRSLRAVRCLTHISFERIQRVIKACTLFCMIIMSVLCSSSKGFAKEAVQIRVLELWGAHQPVSVLGSNSVPIQSSMTGVRT